MAKITIKGLDRFTRNLDKYPVEVADKIDKVLTAGSLDIRARAVSACPVDEGQLRRSITATVNAPLKKRVAVRAEYAPFVEFGTKKYVRVTPGYEEVAKQFQGKKLKNSSFKDLLERIEGWVKRHKIRTVSGNKASSVRNKRGQVKRRKGTYSAAAYWIALKIAKFGVKPRPFFLPAVDTVFDKVRQQIFKIVKSQKL
jgi:HK97 gp10 family phage protein